MPKAGCAGLVVGILANIGIYIIVFGLELTYLGPLWLLPGLIGGLIGGIVGRWLNRASNWSEMMVGALGAVVAFGGMYLALFILY